MIVVESAVTTTADYVRDVKIEINYTDLSTRRHEKKTFTKYMYGCHALSFGWLDFIVGTTFFDLEKLKGLVGAFCDLEKLAYAYKVDKG